MWYQHNYLFFGDDLKFIAVNLNLTQFFTCIEKVFGEPKCAYLAIEKVKIVERHYS